MPAALNYADDGAPIPRRTKFTTASRAWWRPRSTFGQILLGATGLIVLCAVIALGVYVRQFLTRDPHFRIPGASSIQSTGLSEVNRNDLLPVFGEDIGRNIFFVPLSQRRKQLEAIPWVQEATVMRFLPDRLSVNIVERTPVAFVRQGSQVELADADGVILSMPPAMMAQHHYSFPVITGIDSHDSLAARRARMAVYQRFIAELDQNHQHLTDQVSEIDLSDPEDLRATMPEQGSDILAHFGEDQFMHRLQIYKAHISEWRQRYPRLKGVDLRYNGEVPLEMETDSATAAPATIASLKTAPAETSKPAASSASIAQTPTTPPISTKPAAAKANPPSATATAKSIAPPKKAPPKSSAAAHKKAAAQHIAVPKPTNASSSTTTGH